MSSSENHIDFNVTHSKENFYFIRKHGATFQRENKKLKELVNYFKKVISEKDSEIEKLENEVTKLKTFSNNMFNGFVGENTLATEEISTNENKGEIENEIQPKRNTGTPKNEKENLVETTNSSNDNIQLKEEIIKLKKKIKELEVYSRENDKLKDRIESLQEEKEVLLDQKDIRKKIKREKDLFLEAIELEYKKKIIKYRKDAFKMLKKESQEIYQVNESLQKRIMGENKSLEKLLQSLMVTTSVAEKTLSENKLFKMSLSQRRKRIDSVYRKMTKQKQIVKSLRLDEDRKFLRESLDYSLDKNLKKSKNENKDNLNKRIDNENQILQIWNSSYSTEDEEKPSIDIQTIMESFDKNEKKEKPKKKILRLPKKPNWEVERKKIDKKLSIKPKKRAVSKLNTNSMLSKGEIKEIKEKDSYLKILKINNNNLF